jgi:hypothetical protein
VQDRFRASFLGLLTILLSGICCAAPDSPLEGTWTGTLVGKKALHVVFHFAPADNGQWKGTLDLPDQGALGTTFDKLTVSQNAVHWEIWTTWGHKFPLTLTLTTPKAVAAPKRPREPFAAV